MNKGERILIHAPNEEPYEGICEGISHNGKVVHFKLDNGLRGMVGMHWVKSIDSTEST